MASSVTGLKENIDTMVSIPERPRYLQVVFCTLDFPVHVLSIDTLVQEAIQAFHERQKSCKTPPTQEDDI